jgi:hypothetical protein
MGCCHGNRLPQLKIIYVFLEFRIPNSDDMCVILEIALYYDGSGQHLLCASAPLRDIKCIWCSVARLCLAAVRGEKLSPYPLGVEGPVPRTGPRGSTGLGWGLEVYATLTDPTPVPSPEGEG